MRHLLQHHDQQSNLNIMDFEGYLCELINRIDNPKARVLFLEKILKQERGKARKKIIERLYTNAKKDLDALEKKKEISKKPEQKLEEIIARRETTEVPIQKVKDDYLKRELIEKIGDDNLAAKKGDYVPQTEYIQKGPEEAYNPKFESSYKTSDMTATGSMESYEVNKESEEYKRAEQFNQIVESSKKRQDEEDEKKRKRKMGLI